MEEKQSFLEKYKDYYKYTGTNLPLPLWLALGFVVAFGVGGLVIVVLPNLWVLGIVLAIAILDLTAGYPYFAATRRINEIERDLPDVLKQMADTLRAGGTYEFALREIQESELGPIKREVEISLRKLEEGENFENSLRSIADNVDSRIVKRSIAIIIDSVRSGAGLANILEEIAEDVRSTHRIKRERVSRTLLQVLFIVAAGTVVTPMIFGFVNTIVSLLTSFSAESLSTGSKEAVEAVLLATQMYILIEVAAASVMVTLMREGNASKSIIYFPILLLIAFLTYYGSLFVSGSFLGGMGGI